MFNKHFAAAAIATALLSTTALAQTPAPATKEPAPTGQSSSMPRAETPARPEQTQSANEWRSSKVVGLYVYNDANERLGSINELLMDSSGKVSKAVIGVGGFLGIGESNIAVNFDQLKFVNEPMRTSSTTTTPSTGATGSSGSGTVGTTATTTTTTTASKPSINPDHAKLSMTKEQLQALPQFKFAN
jgi:sporulation protein YlmC with PRC-barrel domain